jgi:hypothetical protein
MMNPLWMIGLGGALCVAITILSRIWLPYSDTGTTDGAINHVTATAAVIISYSLMMGYFALSFTKSGLDKKSEPFGAILTGSYLWLIALVSTLEFLGTYMGLSYKFFWSLQVIQYVLLAVVWVSVTKAVVPVLVEREANVQVSNYRKQAVLDSISELISQLSITDTDTLKIFKRDVMSLHDELRFFPNQASGQDAENIMSDVRHWIQRAVSVVRVSLEENQPIADLTQMSQQAKNLQNRIAQWKRA